MHAYSILGIISEETGLDNWGVNRLVISGPGLTSYLYLECLSPNRLGYVTFTLYLWMTFVGPQVAS